MKKAKMTSVLTPWYPYNTRPKRKGWYEVRSSVHHRSRHYLQGRMRYFDGKNFRSGWVNEGISIFGSHVTHQWRGYTTRQSPKKGIGK